jgi:hypothetical protein
MKIDLAGLASALLVLAAWSSAGCGPEPHTSAPAETSKAPGPVEHRGPAPVDRLSHGRADGDPCTRADECKSGVCEGEGCTTGPKCVAADRMCTQDLVQYCGCDGTTFMGSGSCPRRPYRNRGACTK